MNPEVKRILKESIPILILCAIGGIVAGIMLQGMERELLKIPGLLILLPAILGMRGNISGALGSRLASALHLGLIDPELKWNKHLSNNVLATMLLNVLMSFLLGLISYAAYELTNFKNHANVLELTAIAVIAGVLAGLILTALSVLLAILTYARGLDPDNILMPSLSTVGDIITVICLLFAVRIVGYIPYI
ncbi:MAG: divalent cation transporter [Candidatus Altiarchaeales archaeon]|nr:MAG: divalent cation transporter [Candidatus Altiarchaeales archaeon]